ncbi:MAG: hypothetical protein AAF628_27265 [Planctomycetota bacterium]
MRSIVLASILPLSLAATVAAQDDQAAPETLSGARDQLDRAAFAVDRDGLKRARDRCQSWFDDASQGALAHYYAGLAEWRLSRSAADGARHGHILAAIEHLEASVENDAELADAWALLSYCRLLHLAYKPEDSGTFGPASSMAMARATELAPGNRRVVMFNAMRLFQTPAEYGGSQDEAFARFRAATELAVPAVAVDDAGPVWGDAEVWGEFGRFSLLASPPRPEQALQAFEQAVEREPGYRFVTVRGMPRAKRMLAEDGG